MGKAAMCIQMLQILNSGRIYKVSELADLLETNPRNVIEYKRELEEAGYYIISVPGKFGGYRLDTSSIIPSLKFTDEESKALSEGVGYLSARKDFLFKKDYKLAMSKVYSSIKHGEPVSEPLIINRFPLAMANQELQERYSAISYCVQNSTVLKIEYCNLKNETIITEIEPYNVFMYNDAWYFLGFDLTDNDFRYFKINRIGKLEKTKKRFRKRLYYTENDFIDPSGMKRNGDFISIKLKITGAYAVIAKEKVFGKNQVIETQADGSVILSCDMQNADRVISFILSMGDNCVVLEPSFIKEKVIEKAKAIINT